MANQTEIKNLFRERKCVELNITKALYEFVEKVQGDKPFIELGDDNTFLIYDKVNNKEYEVTKVKAEFRTILFTDNSDEDCWYNPNSWGFFNDEELFYCIVDYAKENDINID